VVYASGVRRHLGLQLVVAAAAMAKAVYYQREAEVAALRALAMPLRALAMPIRVLAIQAQATCALAMDNKAGRKPGMLLHEWYTMETP
jgi:hypothetical protein